MCCESYATIHIIPDENFESGIFVLQEATKYEEAMAPQSPSPEDIDNYSEDGDIWQYPIPGEGCDYSPPYEHDYPRLKQFICSYQFYVLQQYLIISRAGLRLLSTL